MTAPMDKGWMADLTLSACNDKHVRLRGAPFCLRRQRATVECREF